MENNVIFALGVTSAADLGDPLAGFLRDRAAVDQLLQGVAVCSYFHNQRAGRGVLVEAFRAQINAAAADMADSVVEVVYSIPLCVKGEIPCV